MIIGEKRGFMEKRIKIPKDTENKKKIKNIKEI